MKRILTSLLMLFTATYANAATSTSIKADVTEGFRSDQNLLKNGNFEKGILNWTASGAGSPPDPVSVTTAANVGRGDKSASWDANNASAQYLTSSAVAIPAGLYGRNAEASCLFKTDATDYLLQAYDGSNIVASQTIAAGSTFTRQTLNFIMPSSGNISLRIASQSNAAIAYLDDCYLGEARNLSQVSQATFVGAVSSVGKANCIWTRTSNASYASYSEDTDCNDATAEGSASKPATKIPAIKLDNLPPGTYYFVANGQFYTETAGYNCSYKFTDGTLSSETQSIGIAGGSYYTMQPTISGHITYTTAGNRVIEVQGTGQNGNNACAIYNNQTSDKFQIQVYRFPTTSETAMRVDQATAGFGTATQAGAANCKYSESTSSGMSNWVDLGTAGSCASAWITTGSVTATGATSHTITVNNMPAGDYMVTLTGGFYTSTSGSCLYRFSDGTNTFGFADYYSASGAFTGPVLTGLISYTSVGSRTFKVQAADDHGGNCNLAADNAGQQIQWTVIPLTRGLPAPYLVGGVSSSSAGQERVERVSFGGNSTVTSACTGSPCTLAASGGTGVTNVTRSNTGQYTVNWTTAFAAKPTCSCTLDNEVPSGNGTCLYSYNGSSTSTSFVRVYNLSGAALDAGVHLVCMGPK